MTQSTSFVGLFCEDIREEKSGQDTIIGVFPDNFAVTSVPVLIPKLALYIRLNFDAPNLPTNISLQLTMDNKEDISLGNMPLEIIEKGKTEADTNEMPFVGLIFKGIIAPFQIQSFGKIMAIVTVDGKDNICGALNIVRATK
jgi:hypothetical protein